MAQIEHFIQSAWQHLKNNRNKQAMDCAKKAHAISPNSPDVAHLLGLLASRDGKPEIALPLLQKSIDLGGKSPRKLTDIAEALLTAGFPEAAMNPIQDAIKEFGENSELLGLKSAIEIALEQWDIASKSAHKAIALNPNQLAWELNLSFAQLALSNFEDGFKYATSRPESLKFGSACPTLTFASPCVIWLKGEQGIGDTLFYLRFIPYLIDKGWQFHLEVDKKLIPILEPTNLFLSIKDKNPCPINKLAFNVGDLALIAMQCGMSKMPPPLSLQQNPKLVEKYKKELAEFGPPPYIAITWRGGPKGNKYRDGVRMLEKIIDPTILGTQLSRYSATIVNIQRLPVIDESIAFHQALGRKSADYTALNNNLQGMLALLSLMDEYVTVSNTNLHLREGLAKKSIVFMNMPIKDWRWPAKGKSSVWYPQSQILRQDKNHNWETAITQLSSELNGYAKNNELPQRKAFKDTQPSLTTETPEIAQANHRQYIKDGWSVVADDISLAISKAKSVLADQPNHPEALHLLGWAAVQDLKFDIAESVLERAFLLSPNSGVIAGDYVRCLVLREQAGKAIQIGLSALQNSKLDGLSAIHFALATAYNSLDEYENAIAHYDKCIAIAPNHLDALSYAGMLRLKLGKDHARLGFKQYSARKVARLSLEERAWQCPVLKGDISQLSILITREMGLGDELSCLRYLPYLVNTGAKVSYWGGAKLIPLLKQLNYPVNWISDTEPLPNHEDFDITFGVHDLPYAVEHLNAPEIASPLALKPNAKLVKKWQKWLKEQGEGPYIGVNWRAGVSSQHGSAAFKNLSKSIEPSEMAKSLANVKATWISLQRNITLNELKQFEQQLGAPIADFSSLTDSLEDILALQSLLDENIGVSNTNMHLRAGLGKGSRVLVPLKNGDWRWGVEGNTSVWFADCELYRESKLSQWDDALKSLNQDLVKQYGIKAHSVPISIVEPNQTQTTKKIIWVSAGDFISTGNEYSSSLDSAMGRVINVAKRLKEHGWQSAFVTESISETMGAWNGQIPKKGDIVVFSKVMTAHAFSLLKDAKDRGALIVVDIFNDFSEQPKRKHYQQQFVAEADAVVSIASLQQYMQNLKAPVADYIEDIKSQTSETHAKAIAEQWQRVFTDVISGRKTEANLTKASTGKRVLVGLMYCGENEYQETIQALHKQTHKTFELFEIKNLPNKEAHDQLYETFMRRASDYDYFLKLDADMVLAHENVLNDMLETMQKNNLAHLFAWVNDCPSGIKIPGIQMFKSDTKWLGSNEQLNVDYPPKINGYSHSFLNKNWINHMPNPDDYQLFRYGVHKALKSIQPDRDSKNIKKGILHLSILNGIARNAKNNSNLWLALIGATLVYEKAFDSIEYNGEQAKKYFDVLKNKPQKYEALKKMAEEFWSNEVQVNYWWLENFDKFKL